MWLTGLTNCFLARALLMCARYGASERRGERIGGAGLHFRVLFSMFVVPLALLLLVRQWIELSPDSLTLESGLGASLFLLVLLWLYPLLVSMCWRTRPLADEVLKVQLASCCAERRLRLPHVRIWETSGSVVNALVVGMAPRFRRVLLTDELLRQFDHGEVTAIFRHELGHLVNRHLWIRLAAWLVPVAIAGAVLGWGNRGNTGSVVRPAGEAWIAGAAALAFCVSWLLVIVIPLYQWCEYQADRYALLEAAGRPCPRLRDDYCSALLRLALHNQGAWDRGSLFHPPIRERIARIHREFDTAGSACAPAEGSAQPDSSPT